MANSKLSTYTNISPSHSKFRNHKIDTITPHCSAGSKYSTAKDIVDYVKSRGISCHYSIGGNGDIATGLQEEHRSWCTSDIENDNRAITIEVASNGPGTEVTNEAYEALIKLMIDICQRNDIKELVWSTDKYDRIHHRKGCNITVHRDYANKACPGEWLYSRMGTIAERVNKGLGVTPPPKPTPPASKPNKPLYRVQVGAFGMRSNAEVLLAKLKKLGFDGFIVNENKLFKVQVGAYSVQANAEKTLSALRAKGIDGFIKVSSADDSLKLGDEVKLEVNAPQYDSPNTFQAWVYSSPLYVRGINGDRILISTNKSGAITGAVHKKYLTKT